MTQTAMLRAACAGTPRNIEFNIEPGRVGSVRNGMFRFCPTQVNQKTGQGTKKRDRCNPVRSAGCELGF
jgi:hypothetical protein